MEKLTKPLRDATYWPEVIFDRHVRLALIREGSLNAPLKQVKFNRTQTEQINASFEWDLPRASFAKIERGMTLLVDDIIEGSYERDLSSAVATLKIIKTKALKLRKLSEELNELIGAATDSSIHAKSRLFSGTCSWMVGNARWSFESELDPLIALCEKGLSVNKRKPVDLFLVLYFWFVFEALPRGVPSTIPSNDSKTKRGAPTKSPVFQLARLTMQPLLLLAEQTVKRSRLKGVQLDRALLRIEGYRKITDDQIIDRLRQAKEMQETPDLEHFAREIEDGHYR